METFPPRSAELPAEGALLALDVGDRRVGVAVCDAERRVVLPLAPLRRSAGGQELAALRQAAVERRVVGVVCGLPLLADGQAGAQARKVLQYARRIERALGLPVAFVDERHSTALAGRQLVESGRTGERQRRRYLDSLAASVILEDYLAGRS